MDSSGIVAQTSMMIRRPVEEVFKAIVDPAVTTRFWFTRGSGELQAGERVCWEWEMYGVAVDVDVDLVEENRRVVMRWPSYSGRGQTRVEWTLEPLDADRTFVTITNDGFDGDAVTAAAYAVDATGGFTFALAGMKAWLECGIDLNLVADRHPRLHSGAATPPADSPTA